MNNVSPGGLKSIVRKQILQALESSKSTYKVLVLDENSIKIVNKCLTMTELMDVGITLVEQLEKRRQAYQTMDAVYVVSSSSDSVLRIIEDFTRNKYNRDGQLYLNAHLFFLSQLDDRLFYKLKQSTANNFIKTCKELYLEFLVVEPQVFILNKPNGLISFFGSEVSGEFLTKEFYGLAKQLCSFFVTLNEFPIIRYSSQTPNGDRITGKLAALLNDELERYSKVDQDFPSNDPTCTGSNKACLILLDRSVDVLAPLLHEFTYQAMANDLLPLLDNGSKYKYTYNSNTEGRKEKEALLDCTTDALWNSVRHVHIADCINVIINDFNKFLTDNSKTIPSNSNSNVSSLRELRERLSAVPQFQELKTKFSIHLNMVQECMSIFKNKKLSDLATVEQELATGETADGDIPKQIEINMIPLLDNSDVSLYDKVRLLMIYIIGKEGVKDDDRKKLFEHSGITSEFIQGITNLSLLGVRLSASKDKRKSPKKDKKKKRNEDDDVSYDLSRYVPMVKNILQDLSDGVLKADAFPFIRDPNSPVSYGGTKNSTEASNTSGSASNLAPSSLRSTKPSWHQKKAASEAAPVEEKKRGGKIVLFIAGGVSWNEIRTIYEVGKAMKRDIYIGSTHVLTPNAFVDDLKILKNQYDGPKVSKSNIAASSTDSLKESKGNSLTARLKGLTIGRSKKKEI